MPIYEYRCKKGHQVELLEPIMDEPLDTCTICGAPAERVLFAPAVHFKGSGFYNTDYGTKKRSRELKASAESGADKTDAKGAEKKETSTAGESTSSTDSGNSSTDSSKSKADSKAPAPAKSSDS